MKKFLNRVPALLVVAVLVLLLLLWLLLWHSRRGCLEDGLSHW